MQSETMSTPNHHAVENVEKINHETNKCPKTANLFPNNNGDDEKKQKELLFFQEQLFSDLQSLERDQKKHSNRLEKVIHRRVGSLNNFNNNNNNNNNNNQIQSNRKNSCTDRSNSCGANDSANADNVQTAPSPAENFVISRKDAKLSQQQRQPQQSQNMSPFARAASAGGGGGTGEGFSVRSSGVNSSTGSLASVRSIGSSRRNSNNNNNIPNNNCVGALSVNMNDDYDDEGESSKLNDGLAFSKSNGNMDELAMLRFVTLSPQDQRKFRKAERKQKKQMLNEEEQQKQKEMTQAHCNKNQISENNKNSSANDDDDDYIRSKRSTMPPFLEIKLQNGNTNNSNNFNGAAAAAAASAITIQSGNSKNLPTALAVVAVARPHSEPKRITKLQEYHNNNNNDTGNKNVFSSFLGSSHFDKNNNTTTVTHNTSQTNQSSMAHTSPGVISNNKSTILSSCISSSSCSLSSSPLLIHTEYVLHNVKTKLALVKNHHHHHLQGNVSGNNNNNTNKSNSPAPSTTTTNTTQNSIIAGSTIITTTNQQQREQDEGIGKMLTTEIPQISAKEIIIATKVRQDHHHSYPRRDSKNQSPKPEHEENQESEKISSTSTPTRNNNNNNNNNNLVFVVPHRVACKIGKASHEKEFIRNLPSRSIFDESGLQGDKKLMSVADERHHKVLLSSSLFLPNVNNNNCNHNFYAEQKQTTINQQQPRALSCQIFPRHTDHNNNTNNNNNISNHHHQCGSSSNDEEEDTTNCSRTSSQWYSSTRTSTASLFKKKEISIMKERQQHQQKQKQFQLQNLEGGVTKNNKDNNNDDDNENNNNKNKDSKPPARRVVSFTSTSQHDAISTSHVDHNSFLIDSSYASCAAATTTSAVSPSVNNNKKFTNNFASSRSFQQHEKQLFDLDQQLEQEQMNLVRAAAELLLTSSSSSNIIFSSKDEHCYRKLRSLGQGSYANAWLVEWIPPQEVVSLLEDALNHSKKGRALVAAAKIKRRKLLLQKQSLLLAEASSANIINSQHQPQIISLDRASINVDDNSALVVGVVTGGGSGIVASFSPHAITTTPDVSPSAPVQKQQQRQQQTTTTIVLTNSANSQNNNQRGAFPSSPSDFLVSNNNNNNYNTNYSDHDAKQLLDQLSFAIDYPIFEHLLSPPAPVSALASTRPLLRVGNSEHDFREIPRSHIFVCKSETKDKTTKRMSEVEFNSNCELSVLRNVAHPCIVAYVDEVNTAEENNIFMEYVDGGDLKSEIRFRSQFQDGPRPFSEQTILFLFVQICLGVEYLHRHNIIHRDLKSANILLSKKLFVKLADFGFAFESATTGRDVDYHLGVADRVIGTPYYMDATIWTGKPYNAKSDVWALGVLLYEMTALQVPFPGQAAREVAEKIVSGAPPPPIPPNPRTGAPVSPELLQLINMCLIRDPELRPSVGDVLRTPQMLRATQTFLTRFADIAGEAPRQEIDQIWAEVLIEHVNLIYQDGLTVTVTTTTTTTTLTPTTGQDDQKEKEEIQQQGRGVNTSSPLTATKRKTTKTTAIAAVTVASPSAPLLEGQYQTTQQLLDFNNATHETSSNNMNNTHHNNSFVGSHRSYNGGMSAIIATMKNNSSSNNNMNSNCSFASSSNTNNSTTNIINTNYYTDHARGQNTNATSNIDINNNADNEKQIQQQKGSDKSTNRNEVATTTTSKPKNTTTNLSMNMLRKSFPQIYCDDDDDDGNNNNSKNNERIDTLLHVENNYNNNDGTAVASDKEESKLKASCSSSPVGEISNNIPRQQNDNQNEQIVGDEVKTKIHHHIVSSPQSSPQSRRLLSLERTAVHKTRIHLMAQQRQHEFISEQKLKQK